MLLWDMDAMCTPYGMLQQLHTYTKISMVEFVWWLGIYKWNINCNTLNMHKCDFRPQQHHKMGHIENYTLGEMDAKSEVSEI